MNGWLAVLAGAACVGWGSGAARQLDGREKELRAWEEALSRLEGALAGGGEELPFLLRRGAGGQIFPLYALAEQLERDPARPAEALLSDFPADPLLTAEEKETLRACVRALFSPDLPAQARTVARCREDWAVFRRRAEEKKEKNARLYRNLGWLGGAAVFILLI